MLKPTPTYPKRRCVCCGINLPTTILLQCTTCQVFTCKPCGQRLEWRCPANKRHDLKNAPLFPQKTRIDS